MLLWYSKAQRDPQQDGGTFVSSKPRGVLHTTESRGYPSYQPGTHPHFTVYLDGKVARVRQHVPLNLAARALLHPGGTVDTNREDAYQIEIAWFAADIHNVPLALVAAVRDVMRFIEGETGVKPVTRPFKPYPASYGQNNGVRMTEAQWVVFTGWCGHEHVPNNDHGDPGLIDMTYLLSRTPDSGKKPSVARKIIAKVVRKIPVTGRLDATTILALQRSLGVKASGVLDVATRRVLQAHLHVAVDGVIGHDTTVALQKRVGSTADGAWGPNTTKALQNALNARKF